MSVSARARSTPKFSCRARNSTSSYALGFERLTPVIAIMLEAAATNVLADVLTRKARYVAASASRSPSDAVDSLYLL
jgi:hypothetical protein